MACPRCTFENPPAMAFCGRCGARLAVLCPSCGSANPEGFAFRGKCGTRVAEAPTVPLQASPAFLSPQFYTPRHLAEKILTSKTTVAQRALDLAHRQKERGSEAWVLRLLGEIAAHADPPDPESAEGHYRLALARTHKLGMRPLAAHCHLGLGTLDRRIGKREPAQEPLSTAATMYREMGMRFWLAKSEQEATASD
jgi:Double zinc ribbon